VAPARTCIRGREPGFDASHKFDHLEGVASLRQKLEADPKKPEFFVRGIKICVRDSMHHCD
jgi:hypothetical protein